MDFIHPSFGLLNRLGFSKPTPKHGGAGQSQRLRTVYELLDGYKTLNPDKILEPLDDANFTQQVLPFSLDMPARNKTEFRPHATGVCSVFQEFKMEPYAVFEDSQQNAVVVHAKMIGKMAADKGGGPWENECVMMMRFNPDGTKVVEHREFVDSAKAKVMMERNKPKDFETK